MTDRIPRTVVIGGGPAGLATAYRLSSRAPVFTQMKTDREGAGCHLGGRERPPPWGGGARLVPAREPSVLLLERAPLLGGLAAGFRHGDYTLDFGPHRLHTSIDPAVLDDLRSLLDGALTLRPRRGLIRLRGRYLPYPIGPRSLVGLGPSTVARLAFGAVTARLGSNGPPCSYEAALRQRLGGPAYELFYGPYAEKVWGRPGQHIAADQAERRVNQRGPADLLRAALGRGARQHYLYPSGGFGQIPAAYANALADRPSVRISCRADVQQVRWQRGRVAAVDWADESGKQAASLDHLVWTAPLPELLRRLDPPPPPEVLAAAESLRYRAVVMCYVVLRRSHVGQADTYYFPERRFPFNRAIEQKRFDAGMVPADRTVLGMDIACDPDDTRFQATDRELAELVLPALEEAGLARRDEVVEVFSRRLRSAYPVYDRGYGRQLAIAEAWLTQLENLWLVGRQGLFLHNNTHHSLQMGYRAADAISAGDRGAWASAVVALSAGRVED